MKTPYRYNEFGDPIVDKAAFARLANEVKTASMEARKDESKCLSNYNKFLSSIAGVAELQNIEADFEVLNIYRDSIPLDICEMRPLPLGTLPLYRSKYINPVGIGVASLAGVRSGNYYATRQFGQQVYPFTFGTDEVRIPNLNNLYDMQKLSERRDGLARIDQYLELGINNSVINTVFANPQSPSYTNIAQFDPAQSIISYAANGGFFAGKTVYVLDPGVRIGAVPSVNYYDLSSTESGLTKKVFQTVKTHSIQIGRNFNKMYIPQSATSGHSPVWESLQNLATPVALVVGQGNANPAAAVPHEMWSDFQKDDFAGAVDVDWFGTKVSIKKQNWIPEGYVLLFCDEPAAILWDRLDLQSGQPQEGVLEKPENGFYSLFSRSKNIAVARPDFLLRNVLLLKLNA